MSTREVRGLDGTALRAWCNDGTGMPVLLCNGLGARCLAAAHRPGQRLPGGQLVPARPRRL